MHQQDGETCSASGGGTRCADCTDVACALRALVGGTSAGAAAPCAHPRRVRWHQRVAMAYMHPQIRLRLPTALMLVVGAAAAATAHGLSPLSGLGLAMAGLLGLWWSAPRAPAARWPELVLLAAATAALAAGRSWNVTWPVPAISLALAATRLHGGRAAGAWALSGMAAALTRATAGYALSAVPLLGLTLAAALGLLISERREGAARERQLLAALLEADVPSGAVDP